jgi:hypothetical protein
MICSGILLFAKVQMKRESGESPGQSRCCELNKRLYISYATA